MAEESTFPRWYFSKDEPEGRVKDSATGADLCGSRVFASQEELDAAGGAAVWKATPQEATQVSQPTARATSPPEDDESHTTRSRR